MTVKEIENQVVRIVRRNLGKEVKVYLFGSWAKGKAQPTSDVDIAIDTGKKIDFIVFSKIRSEIDSIPTLRKIDVIDLNSSNKKFSDTILKYALAL